MGAADEGGSTVIVWAKRPMTFGPTRRAHGSSATPQVTDEDEDEMVRRKAVPTATSSAAIPPLTITSNAPFAAEEATRAEAAVQ